MDPTSPAHAVEHGRRLGKTDMTAALFGPRETPGAFGRRVRVDGPPGSYRSHPKWHGKPHGAPPLPWERKTPRRSVTA